MRALWAVLLISGCAQVDTPEPVPVALPTRDKAVIDPTRDQGVMDAAVDRAVSDGAPPDAALPDPDATPPDAQPVDAMPPDAQMEDAAPIDAMPGCVDDSFCAEDEHCEDGACIPGRRPECADDGDCEPGEQCINAVCARGGCEQNTDCDLGERCVDNACVPDLIECQGPNDCPMGEDCIDGRCAHVQPPQCVENADCGEGKVCEMGACIPGPDCVENGDCGEGEVCEMGACVPGPDCVENADCGEGEVCEMGACVPGPGCVENADCGEGEVCEMGACVPAPIGGGTCAEPLPLPLGEVAGITAGASAVEGACGGDAAPELVFSHVAAQAGPICFDSDGSDFDTVMYVRDGDCDGAELACNDDRPGLGLTSELTIEAQANQTLIVVVDGYRDRSGAVSLTASSGACGDVCGAIPAIPLGEQRGSTVDAGADRTGGCGRSAASPDTIFRWRAAAAGPVCVRTAGSDFDTVLYVRTACDDAGSQVACNDDVEIGVDPTSQLSFEAIADTDYYIIVDGYDSFANGFSAGNFVLTLAAGACPE